MLCLSIWLWPRSTACLIAHCPSTSWVSGKCTRAQMHSNAFQQALSISLRRCAHSQFIRELPGKWSQTWSREPVHAGGLEPPPTWPVPWCTMQAIQSVTREIPRQAVTPGGGIPLGEGMRNPCGAVRTNHMMVSSP